jgi:hypothetical protein
MTGAQTPGIDVGGSTHCGLGIQVAHTAVAKRSGGSSAESYSV